MLLLYNTTKPPADDLTLLSQNFRDMQEKLDDLVKESQKSVLKSTSRSTKTCVWTVTKRRPSKDERKPLKLLITYLGSKVATYWWNTVEIKCTAQLQHKSIFLGRSASGPIGPPLFHFYTAQPTLLNLSTTKNHLRRTLPIRAIFNKGIIKYAYIYISHKIQLFCSF